MRKLEASHGTLPMFRNTEDHEIDSSLSLSRGTALQHHSWIKKLETPGGTLEAPL